MGKLTTHILDTANGKPAKDVKIELFACATGGQKLIYSTVTNEDGRCGQPLLEGKSLVTGIYELEFYIGDYYRGMKVELTDPAFLDVVVIRFGISSESENYHVPLIISPFGYSSYRGS